MGGDTARGSRVVPGSALRGYGVAGGWVKAWLCPETGRRGGIRAAPPDIVTAVRFLQSCDIAPFVAVLLWSPSSGCSARLQSFSPQSRRAVVPSEDPEPDGSYI